MDNEMKKINEFYSKKRNNKNILIILLILVILSLVGYIIYNEKILKCNVENNSNNNIKNDENNSNVNNENIVKKDNKERVIRYKDDTIELSDEEIYTYRISFIKIAGQKKENLKYNYNYLEDYYNKYELAKNIARNELYWEDKNYDDEDATGGFKVNLQDFKELYNKTYDEEFDINKLVGGPSEYSYISTPVIKDDYLYGVLGGVYLADSMDYKFIEMLDGDQSDERILVFAAYYKNLYVDQHDIDIVGKLIFKIKVTDDNNIKFLSMTLKK